MQLKYKGNYLFMNSSKTEHFPDIKYLQLFDVLYNTRNVSRAAEYLGQSQPTVSIWLNKLREQLGDPLFVRTQQGMQPTPRAETLIHQSREIIESMRRLSAWEADFQPSTAQRKFTICMTDASHITLLPQILAHIRAIGTKIQLQAAKIDGNTSKLLETGEADIALGYAPWLENGIYQQTLFQQDWVCLVNKVHPRIKTLTLQRYANEGHIAISAGTGYQLLESALNSENIKRNVLLELPGFLGLGPIIATTDLIATLPRHIGETISRNANLNLFTCPVPVPTFSVKQHWHTRFHKDAGNKWLRGIIASLFMDTKKIKTS